MAGEEWTSEELSASVRAYLWMLDQEREGVAYVKARIRDEALAGPLSGRSVGSFEYRMQNISQVLDELGHQWVPGYKPAANVGSYTAARILQALRIEGYPVDDPSGPESGRVVSRTAFQKRPVRSPSGGRTPHLTSHVGEAEPDTVPLEYSGKLGLKNDTGKPLEATYELDRMPQFDQLIFHSRGGTKGSSSSRNADYYPALTCLLARLVDLRATILEITVDSEHARRSVRRLDRRLVLGSYRYPINLTPEIDAESLRLAITRAQGSVGRSKDAKRGSGNPTKRIRVTFTLPHEVPFEEVKQTLSGERSAPNVTVLPLVVLGLTTRPYRALRRGGIQTVGELLSYSSDGLLRLSNLGQGSLNEIHQALDDNGLSLGNRPADLEIQVGQLKESLPGWHDAASRQKWFAELPEEDDVPIETLGLRLGLLNTLRRGRIRTVGELVAKSDQELLNLPSLGQGKLGEIVAVLAQHGLILGDLERCTSEVLANLKSPSGSAPGGLQDDQLIAATRQFFDKGSSLDEICAQLDLTTGQATRARGLWAIEQLRGGLTPDEIAKKLGLTRQRVQQIVQAVGGLSVKELRREQAVEQAEAKRELAGVIRTDIYQHPGTTVTGIAERLEVDEDSVRKLLTKTEKKLVYDFLQVSKSRSNWSEERLLELLQVAATYHWPLTVTAYDELVDVGELDGPTGQVFYLRFGSWITACDTAGVEHGEPWNRTYDSNWSNDDLYRYVCDYLMDPKTDGTFWGFDGWLKKVAGAPSSATFRNRLGTWSEMLVGALERLAQTWSSNEGGKWA